MNRHLARKVWPITESSRDFGAAGSDAVDMALAAGAQRSVEAEQWAELSRSADFPGGN
jgi:hypothetical protein